MPLYRHPYGPLLPLLTLLVLLAPNMALDAFAQAEALFMDPAKEELSLNGSLDVLEDPSGELTFQDMLNPKKPLNFKTFAAPIISQEKFGMNYWLRLRLAKGDQYRPQNYDPDDWLLELDWPFYPVVWFYIPDGKGGWQVMRSGYLPIDAPEVPWFKKPAFPLRGLGSQPEYVYMRIKIDGGPPIRVNLYRARERVRQETLRMLVLGIYYGVLLAMILYNLSMFMFLRQMRYLWYVLSVVFLGMHYIGFNGVAYDFFPPGLGAFFFHKPTLLWMALSLLCVGFFAKGFLAVREYSPSAGMALNIHIGIWLVAPVLIYTLPAGIMDQVMGLLGTISVIIPTLAGFLCWRKGFRPARFFLLAWGFAAIGGVIFSLSLAGVAPFTGIGLYSIQIGTALEMLLLSLALADRVRSLRTERDAYQKGQMRYQALSDTDALTKVYNKRFLMRELPLFMQNAAQSGRDLSVGIWDLDDFKKYNDAYGHVEGDRVLADFARVLNSCLREQDLACRFGGEEFVIILPGSGLEGAAQVAERIRGTLAGLDFHPGGQGPVRVTVSAGLTMMREGESYKDLLRRADEALYQAKSRGKNRVLKQAS